MKNTNSQSLVSDEVVFMTLAARKIAQRIKLAGSGSNHGVDAVWCDCETRSVRTRRNVSVTCCPTAVEARRSFRIVYEKHIRAMRQNSEIWGF